MNVDIVPKSCVKISTKPIIPLEINICQQSDKHYSRCLVVENYTPRYRKNIIQELYFRCETMYTTTTSFKF